MARLKREVIKYVGESVYIELDTYETAKHLEGHGHYLIASGGVSEHKYQFPWGPDTIGLNGAVTPNTGNYTFTVPSTEFTNVLPDSIELWMFGEKLREGSDEDYTRSTNVFTLTSGTPSLHTGTVAEIRFKKYTSFDIVGAANTPNNSVKVLPDNSYIELGTDEYAVVEYYRRIDE